MAKKKKAVYERMDTAELEEDLAAAPLTFKGAERKKKPIPQADFEHVCTAARQLSELENVPLKAAITIACRVYWELEQAR